MEMALAILSFGETSQKGLKNLLLLKGKPKECNNNAQKKPYSIHVCK